MLAKSGREWENGWRGQINKHRINKSTIFYYRKHGINGNLSCYGCLTQWKKHAKMALRCKAGRHEKARTKTRMTSFPRLEQGIDRQIVFHFCDRRERHFRKFSLMAGKPPKACRWWSGWRAGEHPARVLSRTASATPASALPQSRAANRFSFKKYHGGMLPPSGRKLKSLVA